MIYLSGVKRFATIFSTFIIIISCFFGLFIFEEFLCNSGVNGATLIVGQDQGYTTINSALAAASDGDTIRVYAGIYYENLTITKSITLIGNGTANTTIQATTYNNVLKIHGKWVNVSGFTIKTYDPDSSQAGIELYWYGYSRVENCNLSNCYNGIRVKTQFNFIRNNVFYKNFAGLPLESFNNKIENNTFIDNYYGIYSSASRYQQILNNTFYNCSIYLSGYWPENWNSHIINENNLVNGKRIYHIKNKNNILVPFDAGQIIIANSSNIRIENQNLTKGTVGICIGHSWNVKIKNNNISDNRYGIKVERSDNIIFEDLVLDHNEMGVVMERTPNCKFINNTISNSKNRGVDGLYSNGLMFENNQFLNNGIAIDLNRNSNIIIMNNIIDNSYYGIYIYYSSDYLIEKNNLSNNQYGISIDTLTKSVIRLNELYKNSEGFKIRGLSWSSPTSQNIFTRNNITGNTNVGFWFYFYTKNNYVYHNNFLNNYQQAMDYGSNNYWNNSDQEGNYWSDYTGLDNGANGRTAGDGIGDTNLGHPPNERCDYYPFVRLDGWFYPGIAILEDPGGICINDSFRLTWTAAKRADCYILEEAGSDDFQQSSIIFNGQNTSVIIEKDELKSFWYRVKAYNEHHESIWSNSVDIIIDRLPRVPKNLTVSALPEGRTLKISWELNKENTKEYWLYYMDFNEWELLGVFKHPVNNYTHNGLENNKVYYYKLRASNYNDLLSDFTEIIESNPRDSLPPAKPVELKVIETTTDSISLTWKLNKEVDVKGYRIYRYTDESNIRQITWGEPIDIVSKYTWRYTDKNLKDRTTYFYAITAFDDVPNESEFSNVVSSTTLLGQHPPFINHSVVDFSILEDTYDDSSIDLNHWFSDINNDVLRFRCEGDKYLNININSNGMVQIIPMKDWYGFEILTFYANDSYSEVSDQVNITILPVNDPPGELSIKFDEIVLYYEGKNQPAWGNATDADIQSGDELTFTWYSNKTGRIGTGRSINLSLPHGNHQIILNVTDTSGAYSTLSKDLEILRVPKTNLTKIDSDIDCYPDDIDAFPFDPTQWLDSDGDNYGDSPLGNNPDAYPFNPNRWKKEEKSEPSLFEKQYIWLIVSSVIVFLLIIIILLFHLKKRRQ